MKRKLFLVALIAGLLLPELLPAQQVLTAEDALSLGLKNNYDILIAKSQTDVYTVQNSPGQAGMLPSVAVNGSYTNTHNDAIHQLYSNGNEINSSNSNTNNLSAGVALTWTLFDGMKMFVTRQKLEQLEAYGGYTLKAQVLASTSDILQAYYDVVRQKQLLAAITEVLSYNQERVTISEKRLAAGLGPKTDLLQAKVDLNVQKETRLQQELALDQSKRKLNELLARDVTTDFDVSDSIPFTILADRKTLEQKMLAANPELLAFKTQLDVSQLTLREANSQYYPKLNLLGGYNFGRTENSAGFSLLNQSNGWQGGVTLSVPLFQAGSVKRNAAIARIGIDASQVRLQQASLSASLKLGDALAIYDARTKALELEKENEAMARENMQLSLDRLRLGESTSLEVKEAQTTLGGSLTRLATIRYELKAAEIAVMAQAAQF